jgi:haloalkane dehalogenase
VSVEALRTPDERFDSLPDFPFAPRYLEWNGLRLHYVDEGQGAPVVLFHGEPTWGFLYRKVALPLLAAGYRVVAPDYPGFGRSDKPVDPAFYTYDRHTAAMTALVEHLGLQGAAAVVQDWGGPIGLRLAVTLPGRFQRLCLLNTSLFGRASAGFLRWQAYAAAHPDLPVGRLMGNSLNVPPSEAVIAGYDAPFPDSSYKEGVRRFPAMVPTAPTDPGAAEMQQVRSALASWPGPTLVLFSTEDPIFPVSVGRRFVETIPGAEPLQTIEGAGHFLQEDRGQAVGEAITAFLRRTD